MQPLVKINELDQLQKAFSDEVIEPLVTIITEKECASKFKEIDVPANKWIGRIRREIVNILSEHNLKEKINNGLTALMHELYSHGSKSDVYCLINEWKKGITSLNEKISAYETSNNPEISLEESLRFLSLQELMSFSDKHLEDFYACGRTYFLHNQYQDAANVFFVVILFNFFRHNSWVALGLCEERLGHWENALHAFSMGSLTKMDAPIPYIHSAECYIALGELSEAKHSLECAKEAMELHPSEANTKLKDHITDLENRLN